MAQGQEEIENAIKFDPASETAWSYKTNLLLEAAKLAEMEGKMDVKAQLDKQEHEAQKDGRTQQSKPETERGRSQETGHTHAGIVIKAPRKIAGIVIGGTGLSSPLPPICYNPRLRGMCRHQPS